MYNRTMITVRVEELPPEKIEAMHKYALGHTVTPHALDHRFLGAGFSSNWSRLRASKKRSSISYCRQCALRVVQQHFNVFCV